MAIQAAQLEALHFHLRAIGRIDELIKTDLFAHVDRTAIAQVLDQAAQFAADVLTPLAKSGDVEGCRLEDGEVALPAGSKQAFEHWYESGAVLLDLPQAGGGLGFPRMVQIAYQELCDAANLSFGMLQTGQRGSARLVLAHGPGRLPPACIERIVSGQWASTISISEPQAGSDIGRIRTRAEPAGDGTWRLHGSKCWISYGGHDLTEQIVHMVLARVPNGERGTRGLGLFAVGKQRMSPEGSLRGRNEVHVLSLEHKMGLHAAPTCVMAYDGAEAILLGEPGRGCVGNCVRRAAAARRPPDRSPVLITEHADVKRMLLEMHGQTEMVRALVIKMARYLDLQTADASENAVRWGVLADFLLPVAKTIAAETGFAVASQAIQVHGGAGYTRDCIVERIARDIRVAAVYEGTSGIQALDLVTRKLGASGGAAVTYLADEITRSLSACGPHHPFAAALPGVLADYQRVSAAIRVSARAKEVEAGAYAFLRLTGLLVPGWCGMELYASAGGDTRFERRLRAALMVQADQLPVESRKWLHAIEQGAQLLDVSSELFAG